MGQIPDHDIKRLPDFRILFFSDTHLGQDFVLKPKVKKARRGEDFFLNYHKVLQYAKDNDVNLLIHGGDVFYRSKIPQWLSHKVFQPLWDIADYGIPICIVPGNHERSSIPHGIYSLFSNVHVFHDPATFCFSNGDLTVSVSGFPYEMVVNGSKLKEITLKTGLFDCKSDFKIMVFHQLVEGSKVEGYTFKWGNDVIPGKAISSDFDLYLSGHIHRSQILEFQPDGNSKIELLYAGSTEKTSFAERNEDKGFFILDLYKDEKIHYSRKFIKLDSRPMYRLDYTLDSTFSATKMIETLKNLPTNSNVSIRISKTESSSEIQFPTMNYLRSVLPDDMIVKVNYRDARNT